MNNNTEKQIRKIVEKIGLHDNTWNSDVTKEPVKAILALLTSEVEKIADMIKSTNNLRMAKIDSKKDWNNALEQSACKMDALEKEVRKALSDIGGGKI